MCLNVVFAHRQYFDRQWLIHQTSASTSFFAGPAVDLLGD